MKKYALIVGVSRYDDPEIGNLNFAAEDAREVGACLSKVCGFDEVRTLVSGGDHEPDHISVVKALHSFAPILNPEDLFLFYFAGHGIHTANGSYLLASNSLIRMPELAAVPMPLLQQCLSRLDAAERVLILDACRNDPHQGRGNADNLLTQEFSRDILAVAKTPCEGVSPATCVLFSCSEGERAYEWPDMRHGAFTWYLLNGMRGAALDPQGRLTIQGLSRYVEKHVPRWSKKTGLPRVQTPWAQQLGSLREICLTADASQRQKRRAPAVPDTPVPAKDRPKSVPTQPAIQWWIVVDSKENGPLDEAAVREGIRDGSLTCGNECWRDGMDGWKPMGQVAEWAGAFPPVREKPASRPPARGPAVQLPDFLEPVPNAEYAPLGGLNAGSKAAQKRQVEWVEKGYPLEVVMKKLGIVFRLVPPGEFIMGASPGDNEAFYDEIPPHKVTLASPLYVAKFSVTQQQWQAVMDMNHSHFKKGADAKNKPVEQVSWDDCQLFLDRLHDQLDLEFGKSIRLLTEAEWEYACRAGTADSRYGILDAIAWFNVNSMRMPHPVGEKDPNAWGLHDMIGNVWEWCVDSWHYNYENAPSDGRAWPSVKASHVLRGGAWYCSPKCCRASSRNCFEPDFRNFSVGFRVGVDLGVTL